MASQPHQTAHVSGTPDRWSWGRLRLRGTCESCPLSGHRKTGECEQGISGLPLVLRCNWQPYPFPDVGESGLPDCDDKFTSEEPWLQLATAEHAYNVADLGDERG